MKEQMNKALSFVKENPLLVGGIALGVGLTVFVAVKGIQGAASPELVGSVTVAEVENAMDAAQKVTEAVASVK